MIGEDILRGIAVFLWFIYAAWLLWCAFDWFMIYFTFWDNRIGHEARKFLAVSIIYLALFALFVATHESALWALVVFLVITFLIEPKLVEIDDRHPAQRRIW